jgi:cytochrome c551/c552
MFSLEHAGWKFQPAALVSFLLNPQAHYRFNPMPNFRLTKDEARALASWLLQKFKGENGGDTAVELAREGRLLVQESGCLNCHALNLENRFKAQPFAALKGEALERGCLGPNQGESAPEIPFAPDSEELAAVRAFLASDRPRFMQRAPHEEALRLMSTLRCASCHSGTNVAPSLDKIGAKLRPEWLRRSIAGDLPEKARPWLKQRMPGFPGCAEELAVGLAALEGYAAAPPKPQPVDPALQETGARLISAEGGFSCVACHATGESSLALVVESPGINFELAGQRLRKSFFERWVMNPIAIDPATKMPVYFDAEGRSQLLDILDGDGKKQIEAMWQYVRSLHEN